ncbi:MAG: type II toxin-antitoxin system HicB family antitoxin [Phycisphaerales bacterium]|nr:type II toxin-antitoxin system HicB family antitoxin [Phycisphaerales bacterium]MCI0630840.1 type II toxin-antitoxin system HicB family antitoxin [Phycisphaerales bacterium]MCI0674652.1 type II toxin-antitoxin system HicB family antitoxin [Phycisphaerales bacterium]
MKYLVIIEKGPTSYGAFVPDLPGCVAAGRTSRQVRRLIKEAISLHIQDMKDQGQAIPRPTAKPEFIPMPRPKRTKAA